jgi:Fe-S-cluster containining protein
VNLTEDNLCSIYETRPQLCRIPKGLSRQLTKGTADECNRLQRKYGIGEEYRVIIEDNKSY